MKKWPHRQIPKILNRRPVAMAFPANPKDPEPALPKLRHQNRQIPQILNRSTRLCKS